MAQVKHYFSLIDSFTTLGSPNHPNFIIVFLHRLVIFTQSRYISKTTCTQLVLN
jgi:hypothetical protein